ncbi:MAG TPA: helix-turn-helix domain-containing protein [Saprospiraceae bacterium]|nr:helix-turn-helix domain-containing protein [Saprospiraceae bacterium]
MKLYIKHMSSLRCIMNVKSLLESLGMRYVSVVIGKIELCHILSPERYLQLKDALLLMDLELIEDKRGMLVERIKIVIVDMIRAQEACPKDNFSEFIAERINYDYTYLANLFSEVTGITIEYFVILNKVERVKELLAYEELNLTEISYKLDYSSVAHLSSQFKKVTGLTPSFYRRIKRIRREKSMMAWNRTSLR